jgi:putative SOS response-associated peptidase YedK
MRWGLIPSFAKRADDYDVFKGGSSTFNARVESASTSGLWRRLLDNKRGIVLLDGFFEWKTAGKVKLPMFIRHDESYNGHTIHGSSDLEGDLAPNHGKVQDSDQDGPCHAPLLLAALYDVWHETAGGEDGTESVSILTMEPDGTPMIDVHDRMPVFLTPETAALWLDPKAKWDDIISGILKTSQAVASKHLLMYEVSPLVSNIRNESKDCILPKKDYNAHQLAKGIGRFFQKKSATAGGEGTSKDARMGEETPFGKRKAVFEPESSSKVFQQDHKVARLIDDVIELD